MLSGVSSVRCCCVSCADSLQAQRASTNNKQDKYIFTIGFSLIFCLWLWAFWDVLFLRRHIKRESHKHWVAAKAPNVCGYKINNKSLTYKAGSSSNHSMLFSCLPLSSPITTRPSFSTTRLSGLEMLFTLHWLTDKLLL